MLDTAMLLCSIVRDTIVGQRFEGTPDNPALLFRMAKENGLSGTIYHTLCHSEDTTELCEKLRREHYVYVATAARQDEAMQDLRKLFDEAGIDHVFMKGSRLRNLYPAPHMRSMGDIDVLVRERNMDDVHQLLETHGYVNPVNSEAHDLFTHTNQVTIEVHPRISRNIDGGDHTLFDTAWDHAVPSRQHEHQLEIGYELVYLIYHMAKHFRSGGVGLRTFLDIGLYVEHYAQDIRWDTVRTYLDEIGYRRFAVTVLAMAQRYFGLPTKLPEPIEWTEGTFELMTRYVALSGVHGTGERFNRALGRISSTAGEHPRWTHLRRMIFPSRQALRHRYRFLDRTVLLYPVAWTMRLIRVLFTNRRKSIQMMRQTAIPKQHIHRVAEMFEEIGL